MIPNDAGVDIVLSFINVQFGEVLGNTVCNASEKIRGTWGDEGEYILHNFIW